MKEEKKRTVMITGAGGKVAQAIAQLLADETDWAIIMLSSRMDSIEHRKQERWFQATVVDFKLIKEICDSEKPDVILNCAAMTDVDGCEKEKKLAQDLNVNAVENLARAARKIDSHLIHLSTDYVFDGNKGPYLENDIVHPINYYGKTKLAGENACKTYERHTIVRTNVVYGKAPGIKTDFVQWVLQKCKANEAMNVVNDQYGNPTFNEDIALGILRIIEKERYGIYNIAGADYVNRFEFANTIARVFNYEQKVQINPITTSSLNQLAKRPLKGGLITLKMETDLGVKPTTLESGLLSYKRHLQKLYSIK